MYLRMLLNMVQSSCNLSTRYLRFHQRRVLCGRLVVGPYTLRNNLHTISSRIEGRQRRDIFMLDFPARAASNCAAGTAGGRFLVAAHC
jgi:hypothetical protein